MLEHGGQKHFWMSLAPAELAVDVEGQWWCDQGGGEHQISPQASWSVSVLFHSGRRGIKIPHLTWRDTAPASLIPAALSWSSIYQDYSLLRQVISVRLEWLLSRAPRDIPAN